MVSNKAPTSQQVVTITIDGPAGAGKSTVAKALAKRLRISYLDTGAMYRALTLKALRRGLNLEDEEALAKLAHETTIDFQGNSDTGLVILLDGEDVSKEIRSIEVTNNTFYIARAPRVREVMVQLQRKIGAAQSVVVEGRDVGTVVFPKASHKFYLDANFEERSLRRIKELEAGGKQVDAQKLKAQLQDRDHKDISRKVGPLKKADDAVAIDSTHLSVDEVVALMLKHIQKT